VWAGWQKLDINAFHQIASLGSRLGGDVPLGGKLDSLHIELQILREDLCNIPGARQSQVACIVFAKRCLRGHEDGFAIRVSHAEHGGPVGKLQDLLGWDFCGVPIEHDADTLDGAAGRRGWGEQHSKRRKEVL
jgi:hypothetical protein